jgi:hypothetical protein
MIGQSDPQNDVLTSFREHVAKIRHYFLSVVNTTRNYGIDKLEVILHCHALSQDQRLTFFNH